MVAWRSAAELQLWAVPPRSEPYTIGRAPSVDIVVDEARVSAAHALLRVLSPADVYATDDGSANGTYLDGLRLRRRTRVFDGGVLRLGPHVQILVRLPGPVVGTVTVESARLEDLTTRQLEIVWWLAEPIFARGHSRPQNWRDLREGLLISESTLGQHLTAAAATLGVEPGEGMSRRLAERAIELGIATVPRPGTR